MLNAPQTLEEAEQYRYNRWAGNPDGNDYEEGYCVYEVWTTDGWGSYQCQRNNGKGPSGLYCWQHAKMVEKEQDETHTF